jgi:hypothetical protein
MAEREFPFNLYLEQVEDGIHYKGLIGIGSTKFEYDLVFGVHLKEIDDQDAIQSEEEVRQLFQLKLSKDGVNIHLNKDEFLLFFSLLFDEVYNFYNQQQTHFANDELRKNLSEGRETLAQQRDRVKIFIDLEREIGLKGEQIEILSTPKFGCIFANA